MLYILFLTLAIPQGQMSPLFFFNIYLFMQIFLLLSILNFFLLFNIFGCC